MGTFLSWLQAFASSEMNPLLCLLLTSAQSPHALLHQALPSEDSRKAGQISPGKNMIFPSTTAALTIPHVLQTGFVMLCPLTQGFGLVCDFCSSARRFGVSQARLPALRLLLEGRSPFRPRSLRYLPSASTFLKVTLCLLPGICTGDLHPIKSCPCRAHTMQIKPTQKAARLICVR